MEDLSHWDIVATFLPEEAATLAVGLDPAIALSPDSKGRRDIVLREIFSAYNDSVEWVSSYVFHFDGLTKVPKDFALERALEAPLMSIELRSATLLAHQLGNDELPSEFSFGNANVTFDRETLQKWFKDRKFRPQYVFVIDDKPPLSQSSDQPIGPQERASLYKLVIGMAIDGYGYNPTAKRNDATSEIANGLQERGIGLDVDTVRNWLQKAAAVLPDTPNDA